GSDNGNGNERPAHQVYLNTYYMDKYEVTNAFYKACVDEKICTDPKRTVSYTRSNYYSNSQYSDYPVIYVDWNMAKNYCEWRGARLPTEAEWEKAARGTDGRTYPWGESLNCFMANYSMCVGDTSAVGSYEGGQSPYGIYDMAGNVWEWVADWYQDTYYQNSPFDNPLGPSSGQYRVLRGGSWDPLYAKTVRTTNRGSGVPTDTYRYVGFRCTRSFP
ncbi:MAG: formylglycine-generating enzyme family protein, partial [Chloroflexota bacterium]